MIPISTEIYRYNVFLFRYRRPNLRGGETELIREWRGLRLDQLTRWDWYFRYRAAIEQLKTPRNVVEFRAAQYEHLTKDQIALNEKRRKIQALKAKITKAENRLREVCAVRSGTLFPAEQDPDYHRVLATIESWKCELRTIMQS